MVNLRSGKYGSYYGSHYNQSEHLTEAEMQVNARYIYSALLAEGWSMNAICALLGNMQAESSLNPGRWQSEAIYDTNMGYGLVQWTPASKYLDWCQLNGFSDPSEMDANLSRIIYEVENNLQWIATSTYDFSFKEFTTSTRSVDELARSFILNYERPADQSESAQGYRSATAEKWYTFLTGESPITPTPSTAKKKKKFKFVLFNQRRNQWIR